MLNRFFHTSYRLFYDLRYWRKRHITPAGILILAMILLSGLFGFNIFRTTLYQVFALATTTAFFSFISSLFPFKTQIAINRFLPDYASVDEPFFYDIELTNATDKAEKGLILFDEVKDPRPDLHTLLSQKEPYERFRNAWDKKTLYYRWSWLIWREKKAVFTPIRLPDIPANQTIKVRIQIIPRHRGTLYFSGVTLARSDILGLFNRLHYIQNPKKILILPRRFSLPPPTLFSIRQHHPGGIHLASSIGNANEFMSLRKYRPGDPLKNIHWRTFAKTQELVIKEFEDEFFVRHALILDTFLSDDTLLEFEQAVSIASSYVQAAQTHESILDLMFVGNQVYSFTSGRNLSHSEKMLEILASVQPSFEKSIQCLMPLLKQNIKQFSGSICIFLNWTDTHKKIVRLFEKNQIPAFIVLVTDDPQTMKEKMTIHPQKHLQIKIVDIRHIEKDLG